MKFASWTISPVSDISRYVSEGLVTMSCPSWRWHRTGSRWFPVRTLPVAPLWCDLGFVPNSRGNKAAANLCPSHGFVRSVSSPPRILSGGNAGGASPVRLPLAACTDTLDSNSYASEPTAHRHFPRCIVLTLSRMGSAGRRRWAGWARTRTASPSCPPARRCGGGHQQPRRGPAGSCSRIAPHVAASSCVTGCGPKSPLRLSIAAERR